MHSKPSLVMSFYNDDPLMHIYPFAKPIIDAASTKSLEQTFNNPKFIYKQFNNLNKSTISTILQYSRCIGHETPFHNVISNQPYSTTLRHHLPSPPPDISSLLPPKSLETHAKIFIFTGAISKQPYYERPRHNNLPCLNLADGSAMSITSELITPLSSPCPFMGTIEEPSQPLIFIFLSTRGYPKLHITPPTKNSTSLEIWSIFNRYADSTHGFSSIKALSNIQSTDLTTHIANLRTKIQDKHAHTTGITFYKYGTFTHNTIIPTKPSNISTEPCCFRCFPYLD